MHENGATLATLTLSGQYASANFSLASDGDNGTAIGFQNQTTPSGSSADMIMERDADGTYEFYDIGHNAICSTARSARSIRRCRWRASAALTAATPPTC